MWQGMLINGRVKTTLVLNRGVPDQMGQLLNDQYSGASLTAASGMMMPSSHP